MCECGGICFKVFSLQCIQLVEVVKYCTSDKDIRDGYLDSLCTGFAIPTEAPGQAYINVTPRSVKPLICLTL